MEILVGGKWISPETSPDHLRYLIESEEEASQREQAENVQEVSDEGS